MNYLFLFRDGEAGQTMTPAEMQTSMQKWGAWIGELTRLGQFKGGDPLERAGKVVAGRKKVVTDGPYAESKDLVGGYLLVEAATLDAAVELACGCPIFDTNGTVEVRAVRPMQM
jgi:hypothetical protein